MGLASTDQRWHVAWIDWRTEARMRQRRDIEERAFRFACEVVTLCRTSQHKDDIARRLLTQLLRSGTSIGANLEEAVAGTSRADFLAKIGIARKEARETHYWLRLLHATSPSPQEKVDILEREASELVAILTAISKSASANRL